MPEAAGTGGRSFVSLRGVVRPAAQRGFGRGNSRHTVPGTSGARLAFGAQQTLSASARKRGEGTRANNQQRQSLHRPYLTISMRPEGRTSKQPMSTRSSQMRGLPQRSVAPVIHG